jgi:hypothetical protein
LVLVFTNSHLGTAKYLINKNYSIPVLLKIVLTNAWCWIISFGDQRIISNVLITNRTFLARLNEKRNVEIDSPAASGGYGKYMKYISFPWPPLEAALSVFNVGFFLLKKPLCEGVTKNKRDCHQC